MLRLHGSSLSSPISDRCRLQTSIYVVISIACNGHSNALSHLQAFYGKSSVDASHATIVTAELLPAARLFPASILSLVYSREFYVSVEVAWKCTATI